jgi:RNA polymerase sigma-70 factor (ECF subfamily)
MRPAAVAGEWAEDALLRGLRERDSAACAELCRRFGPRLHQFAVARLGWQAEPAEDVAITTLADGVRNIGRFNPRRSTLSAWLYGIARRHVIRELRRLRRSRSVPLEEAAGLPDDCDAVAGLPARLDAQRRIVQVEAILSPLEYEVLVLSCIDELSAREIGQVTGRSERAIHSLLHRARQKARERLAEDAD